MSNSEIPNFTDPETVTGGALASIVAGGTITHEVMQAVVQNEDALAAVLLPLITPPSNWNAGVTYGMGQMVSYNGVDYVSKDASNIGNEPDTSPNNWVSLGGGATNVTVFSPPGNQLYPIESVYTPLPTTTQFLMQPGSVTFTTDSTGTYTVTFEHPFPNGVLTVLVSMNDGGVPSTANLVNVANNSAAIELTYFQGICRSTSANPMANVMARVNYLAFGW